MTGPEAQGGQPATPDAGGADAMARRGLRKRLWVGAAALCVIFAAGPLYMWSQGDALVTPHPLHRQITLRIASDAAGSGLRVQGQQAQMTLRLDQSGFIYFDVANPGATPRAVRPRFTVTPPGAAAHLVHAACFCGHTQVLQPGERVSMGAALRIVPGILYDRGADDLREIALTYHFDPVDLPAERAGDTPDAAAAQAPISAPTPAPSY